MGEIKRTIQTKITSVNSRFAKAGFLRFYDNEKLNSNFVLLMKFSAENLHLHKAEKR
jgi:hypothetical protein